MLINIAERAHAEVERIFRVILPESGLTVRKEQIALCHSMLDSLLHNTISLCDAGVGIGKTYAYLCLLYTSYQIGTLVTTGSVGAGFVPGLIAVGAFVAVLVRCV